MTKIARTFVFVFGLCFAGLALSQAAVTAGNDALNVDAVRAAAERGDAVAQYKLGKMYVIGQGVEKDDVQAVAWFRKSAEQGSAGGQNGLGFMYRNGRGVQQDDAQAIAWFRKAAEQGNANAQRNLGNMYLDGRGVQHDDAQAVAWFRKAAEQGDAASQAALGIMYEHGLGAPEDDRQAVAWYHKAAEQGNADAQYNLGVMYESGRGIQKDRAQAIAWYQKAAGNGNEKAKRKSALSPDPIEIFGVHLKNATRAQVRDAFKKTPLRVEESNQYWIDLYHSDKALKGSSQLAMGYTRQGQFAYAEYTFPGEVGTPQFMEIADMVAEKYGIPDHFSGDVGHGVAQVNWQGEVDVTWQNDGDVSIALHRGWPDTTLRFSDAAAEKQMNAEIDDAKNIQTHEKAKSQSHAF